MIKLERTFLAKSLPSLIRCKKVEILDIYIPSYFDYPRIRLREHGDKYDITRKYEVEEGDHSKLLEESIQITNGEFCALEKEVKGKRVHKFRYFYSVAGRVAEIDVFRGDLQGLVLVGFKFTKESEMYAFKMPSFCLSEVTDMDFIAGGMLCGKSYKDIEKHLALYNYKKII